jgi:hypothetical protein
MGCHSPPAAGARRAGRLPLIIPEHLFELAEIISRRVVNAAGPQLPHHPKLRTCPSLISP